MKIVVDGDACPVKNEIIETAHSYSTLLTIVASYDHRLPQIAGVDMVQVDRSSQSADMYIANIVKRNDIVITQDFGLACIAMARGAITLSFRGEQYTNDNIDYLLERRAESAKKRRQGIRSKGPKPFTVEDRKRFQQKLTKVLDIQQDYSE